ncbi:MAG: glycosyltransferase family 2 protein, partial [Trueperaceae bacterium]
ALEQQTPLETIVVADGCTDDTLEFLRAYKPNYTLHILETPGKGAAFARNTGAKEAKGKRLLFSDDDVIPREGWLEAHRGATNPNTVVVGKLVLPSHLKNGATMAGPKAFWWNATGANTSMSKTLFFHAGAYDEAFAAYGGEDPDLGWRLKKTGATFAFAEQALAEHWDETYEQTLLQKAKAAGIAHVRVWEKYKSGEIAWALGIHPILLGAKRFTLPLLKPVLGKRGAYEIAYMQGALSELQKHAKRVQT